MIMTQTVETKSFGNTILRLTSDVVDGIKLDTRVEISAHGEWETLCWVSGEQAGEFVSRLQKLVQHYRI